MSVKEISPGIYFSENVGFKFSSAKTTTDVQPTNIVIEKKNVKTEQKGKAEIVSWGEANDTPQKVLSIIKKIGVAGQVVDVSKAAHFGNGFALYEEEDDGNRVKVPFRKHPKFLDFDKKNNINLYYSETINDLEIHDLCFSEFILSNDFNSINKIQRKQPVHCRFVIMNEKTGRIEYVALCGDWENANENNVIIVPCFSQYDYWEDIQAACKEKKINKFIICFHYVKNGEVYYNQPFWHAPLNNGWADIILSVPEVKKYIAENQLHVKYLIHVSEEYFQRAYGRNDQGAWNWDDTFTAEDQKKKRKELADAVNDHLKGKTAAGRSMSAPSFLTHDGKFVKSIEIEPIEDKIKDGAYLPDATAGNAEIATAKGVDPCLLGAGIPGEKNLNGGSNKREAWTILCAKKVIDRTVSLLPFYLIRDWNKLGDNLEGGFPNQVLTTLDKETTGKTEVFN